jgi:Ras-related protein Rab-7A
MGSGASTTGDKVVTEEEARAFLRDLIPLPEDSDETEETSTERPQSNVASVNGLPNGTHPKSSSSSSMQRVPSSSTTPSPIPGPSRYRSDDTREREDSRATSRSRYANGTVTTTMSIYHTAASSLIDSTPPTPSGKNRDKGLMNGVAFWDPEIEDAIASNSAERVGEGEIALDSGYRSVSPAANPSTDSLSRTTSKTGQLLEAPSSSGRRLVSSNSGSSVQTITPSRVNSSSEVPKPASDAVSPQQLPLNVSKPPPGPALFLASAKTGEGCSEVFEYIAQRVTKKWEWEESWLHVQESSSIPVGNGDTRIMLRELQNGKKDSMNRWGCC